MSGKVDQLSGVEILGERSKQSDEILTPEAVSFVVELSAALARVAANY